MGSIKSELVVSNLTVGFHSISFPSEWGDGISLALPPGIAVSIQLVSPASGEEYHTKEKRTYEQPGFHSISFPSEWGDLTRGGYGDAEYYAVVSIQLVSPASGETTTVQW